MINKMNKVLSSTRILTIITAVVLFALFSPKVVIPALAAENHGSKGKHEDDGHDEHGDADHGEEDEHNEHEEEGVVNLTKEEMKEFGIVVDRAGSGKLRDRKSVV